jgi:hypothetical protein
MNISFFKALALLVVSGVGVPMQASAQTQTLALTRTQTAPLCVFTLAGGATPQCAVTEVRPAHATTAAPLFAESQPASLKDPTPPTAAPPPPATPSPSWDLSLKDVTLAEAMTRWARTAGWRVLWDLDKHILIDSPDVYRGSFEQVVTAVLSSPGLANGPYPLEVCFYPNTPPLARITRRGMQGKDCK